MSERQVYDHCADCGRELVAENVSPGEWIYHVCGCKGAVARRRKSWGPPLAERFTPAELGEPWDDDRPG